MAKTYDARTFKPQSPEQRESMYLHMDNALKLWRLENKYDKKIKSK